MTLDSSALVTDMRAQGYRGLLPLDGVCFIGVGHKARHGKDTACRAIHVAYPAITRMAGFADSLRAYAHLVYGMTAKDAPLLQRLGEEWREQDEDCFIRALYWSVANSPAPYILIPDLRHLNEAQFIAAMGGYCIKVVRLGDSGCAYVDESRSPDHRSEVELDDYDGWDDVIRAESGDPGAVERASVAWFSRLVDSGSPA